MQEINLGQYAIPFLITIFLSIVYKPFDNPDGSSKIPDWVKGYTAICIGVILSIIGMFYSGADTSSFKVWVDYILYGFVQGAASIGIFKIAQFTPGIPISPPKE